MGSRWDEFTEEQKQAFSAADAKLVSALANVASMAKNMDHLTPTRYADEHGAAFSTAHGWLLEILLTWVCEETDVSVRGEPDALSLKVHEMLGAIMLPGRNASLQTFVESYARIQEA